MNANCTACKGNHEGSCEHGAFTQCIDCEKWKCPRVEPRCVECCRKHEGYERYAPECPMGWTIGEKRGAESTSTDGQGQDDACVHGMLTTCPGCKKLKCQKICYCVECYRVVGENPSYTFACSSAYTTQGDAVKSTT